MRLLETDRAFEIECASAGELHLVTFEHASRRMIEDMTIRKFAPKTQASYIRDRPRHPSYHSIPPAYGRRSGSVPFQPIGENFPG
jgi:hypothetical protein